MPAIAAGVKKSAAKFYWHLGDFRSIYKVDIDFLTDTHNADGTIPKDVYLQSVWNDFIQHQIQPFGTVTVYLVPGNHEFIPPKTREEYLAEFADWLSNPAIRRQRLQDDPSDHRLKTYYHWIENQVDFITLDNGTVDQFSAEQVTWFGQVLKQAARDQEVRSVVVGMHAALPDSLAADHSMNDTPGMAQSGRQVYNALFDFQRATGKHVYILASHSHFLMEDIFNSEFHRENKLPGWIIGSAGAMRYPLPSSANRARIAKTNVYGYMLATVRDDGEISFEFREISRRDVPEDVIRRYPPSIIDECLIKNTAVR